MLGVQSRADGRAQDAGHIEARRRAHDKLRAGGLSQAVFDKLSELCRALAAGDQRTALDAHTHITNSDWADNGPWLMGPGG